MSTRSTSILCVAFTSALLTGAPGVAFASLHAPRIAVSSTNSDWEHVGGLFQVTAIDHDGPVVFVEQKLFYAKALVGPTAVKRRGWRRCWSARAPCHRRRPWQGRQAP